MENLKARLNITTTYFIAISILVHFGLSYLFLLNKFLLDNSTSKTTIQKNNIEINLVRVPKLKKIKANPVFNSKAILIKNLNLGSIRSNLKSSYLENSQTHNNRSNVNENNFQDDLVYPNDLLNAYQNISIKESNLLKIIWSSIDRFIYTDNYLGEFGHLGNVKIHIKINSIGNIIENKIKIISQDNVLKVLAMHAIRNGLREIDQKDFLKNSTNNDFDFNVKIHWINSENCNSEVQIYKKNLRFCKRIFDNKKSFSKAEKMMTYLSSLKYGFSFYEEIQKYNRQEMHNDTQFDPFLNLKNDPDWNL